MAKRGPRQKLAATPQTAPLPPSEAKMVLHSKQIEFFSSNKIYRGFVSGVGAGKSWIGAFDLLSKSEPGALYAIVAPTYKVLSDATLRTFIELATKFGLWDETQYRKTDNVAKLNNGVEILFRSGDQPGNLRGPTLRGCWMDECSQMKEEVFSVMIGRLRHGGEQGWLCLAGEEEIYDPVAKRSRRLDEIKECFHVYSMDTRTGKRVVAKASVPFRKGVAPLYRFRLNNGRSFVAPMHHWILTQGARAAQVGSGLPTWHSPIHGQCATLTIPSPETSTAGGSSHTWLPLVKCVANLPVCGMWERPSSGPACGCDCSGIRPSSQCDCQTYCRSGDGLPPGARADDRDAPPLPSGVRQHTHGDWRLDAWAARPNDTHSTSECRRSTVHCDIQQRRVAVGEIHASLPLSARDANSAKGDLRSPVASSHQPHTTTASVPLATLSGVPLFIVSCEYEKTDYYYDISVETHQNYEHCELIHHNSGTFTPAGKDHWTYRVFGDTNNQNVTLVQCSTKDNPFLTPEFYENLLLQYGKGDGGALRARQELEGEFVCVEGAEWGPENFGPQIWFADWPDDPEAVKAVALDSSKGIGGKTGDYSVFAIGMFSGGKVWIEFDMDNQRNASALASRAIEIQKSFNPDFFGVESEFGGAVLVDDLANRAEAINILMPLVLIPTQGLQKDVRIRRITPYLTHDILRFRDTEQTRKGVQMLESWPHSQHDDSADAGEMLLRIFREAGIECW